MKTVSDIKLYSFPYVFILVLFFLIIPSQITFAWFSTGHSLITRSAVEVLPDDMPGFFRSAGDTLAVYSGDPDIWRDRNLPALRDAEYPNHYLNIEYLLERKLKLPPLRREFLALCEKNGLDPYRVGTLPYVIMEDYGRLVLAFVEHRMRPDNEAVRAKALYLAGRLSHYTADMSQPLHLTIHHDGRAENGRSPGTGIHKKMDALTETAGLTSKELSKGLKIREREDIFSYINDRMMRVFKRVDRVYKLEEFLPPAEGKTPRKPDRRVRALALETARDGVEVTATVWYSAWKRSAEIDIPEWHPLNER